MWVNITLYTQKFMCLFVYKVIYLNVYVRTWSKQYAAPLTPKVPQPPPKSQELVFAFVFSPLLTQQYHLRRRRKIPLNRRDTCVSLIGRWLPTVPLCWFGKDNQKTCILEEAQQRHSLRERELIHLNTWPYIPTRMSYTPLNFAERRMNPTRLKSD